MLISTRIALPIALVSFLTCAAAGQTSWVDWTSADPLAAGTESVYGSLGAVQVTFTGELNLAAQVSGGVSYWSSNSSTYTSALVTDPPPATDIARLSGGPGTGDYVIQFDQPIRDPVMAVLTLGDPGRRAILDFNIPFVLENSGPGFWGNGPLGVLPGDILQGQEGHGLIRFPGVHSEIRFTAPLYEYWYGFTVGLTGGVGTQLCSPAVANSTGQAGTLTIAGSTTATDNDVAIAAALLPRNTFGYLLNSRTPGLVPNAGGSQGTLCLGGSIGRYNQLVQNSGASGSFLVTLDLTSTPTPTGLVTVAAGETWHFQAWFRDAVAGTPTSNFTDSVAITFQ